MTSRPSLLATGAGRAVVPWLAALALAGLPACGGGESAGARPDDVVVEPVIDLGDVVDDGSVRALAIRGWNGRATPVAMSVTSRTCGCLVPAGGPRTVAARSDFSLPLHLHFRAHGVQRYRVTVEARTPPLRTFPVEVRAHVRPLLDVSPSVVALEPDGERLHGRVVLASNDATRPVRWVGASGVPAGCETRVTTDGSGALVVAFDASPSAVTPGVASVLRLLVDVGERRIASIVRLTAGTPTRFFAVDGGALRLGFLGQVRERSVLVRCARAVEESGLDVAMDGLRGRASVAFVAPDAFLLRIEIDPAEIGALAGAVRIASREPRVVERIPVRGFGG
jgi:hypothetical protein